MFDRIACVKVRIRARGQFVMSTIKSMNLSSVQFWTYLSEPETTYHSSNILSLIIVSDVAKNYFFFCSCLARTTRGRNGNVQYYLLYHGSLDKYSKRDFPVELVKIMRRQAEDLLISDSSNQQGKDTLNFILTLAKERSDLEEFQRG